jgi:hypothetical protein
LIKIITCLLKLKKRSTHRTTHTHITHACTRDTHTPHMHTTRTHHTPMHTSHTHAHSTHTHHAHSSHTPCMHTAPTRTHACTQETHTPHMHTHAQHITYMQAKQKKLRAKEGNLFKSSFFRSWSCCLSQTHLLSSNGKVQLHGGAANWWSCCSRVGLVEPEPSQTRPKCRASCRPPCLAHPGHLYYRYEKFKLMSFTYLS